MKPNKQSNHNYVNLIGIHFSQIIQSLELALVACNNYPSNPKTVKSSLYIQIQFQQMISEQSAQQHLKQQYQILNPIGHGSFGFILGVRNKQNNKNYACKVQKHHGKIILVEKQFQIMHNFQQYGYCPQVFDIQKFKEHSYMIMEKMDHTLYEHFITKKRKFSLPTVALITQQCFTMLRVLHEGGYLHRDLKPQNFMINNYSHQLKIIDFGLADGTKPKKATTLIGNVRFASRGAHFGNSSQKDDLQSMVFVLYHFMTGELPWQSATKTDIEMEIDRKTQKDKPSGPVDTPILKKKYAFLEHLKFPQTKNQIKKVFYEQYTQLMKYIINLNADYDPDYDNITQKCERLLILSGTQKGRCFDWCSSHCPRKIQEQLWDIFQS